jgi:hypothetical protein
MLGGPQCPPPPTLFRANKPVQKLTDFKDMFIMVMQNIKGSKCLRQDLAAPQINLPADIPRFQIFRCSQNVGRSLDGHQIYRFNITGLIFNILSFLYIWLYIKELTKTAYFECFICGGKGGLPSPPPPYPWS